MLSMLSDVGQETPPLRTGIFPAEANVPQTSRYRESKTIVGDLELASRRSVFAPGTMI
jgi:hypothetical protein